MTASDNDIHRHPRLFFCSTSLRTKTRELCFTWVVFVNSYMLTQFNLNGEKRRLIWREGWYQNVRKLGTSMPNINTVLAMQLKFHSSIVMFIFSRPNNHKSGCEDLIILRNWGPERIRQLRFYSFIWFKW